MTTTSPCPSPARIVLRHSLGTVVREQTVAIIAALFVALIFVSAFLGWSATSTVDAIYKSATVYLTKQGMAVPPNPLLAASPLYLLRNMATYVSLIGSLAGIVIGYQLIASDRKAGVMPLIGTRPVERRAYALGKTGALVSIICGLVAFAAVVSVATFFILPGFHLSAHDWLKLFGFYAVSGLYMLVFGLLGLTFGALSRSETVGLLIPITAWLSFTFILPQLTSNINPVASLNPVTALTAPPSSTFFQLTGLLLGPFSMAEAYRTLAAHLLDMLPPGFVDRSAISPWATLLMALVLLALAARSALSRMDMTRGDYNG